MSDNNEIQKVKVVNFSNVWRELLGSLIIGLLVGMITWFWVFDRVEYTGKVETMRDSDFKIIVYVEKVKRKFVIKVDPDIFVNDIQVGDLVHIMGWKEDDGNHCLMDLKLTISKEKKSEHHQKN